jgi:hypothetical protein
MPPTPRIPRRSPGGNKTINLATQRVTEPIVSVMKIWGSARRNGRQSVPAPGWLPGTLRLAPQSPACCDCRRRLSGCLTALVDSILNPPRDDVLWTPTSR